MLEQIKLDMVLRAKSTILLMNENIDVIYLLSKSNIHFLKKRRSGKMLITFEGNVIETWSFQHLKENTVGR